MSINPLKQIVCTGLIFSAIFFSAQGFAAGKIIYMEDAVEADRIEVFIPKGSQSGSAHITGCKGCPMRLSIDPGTRFFFRNQPASSRQVVFLSGKPGTVIFDDETKRALRIRW